MIFSVAGDEVFPHCKTNVLYIPSWNWPSAVSWTKFLLFCFLWARVRNSLQQHFQSEAPYELGDKVYKQRKMPMKWTWEEVMDKKIVTCKWLAWKCSYGRNAGEERGFCLFVCLFACFLRKRILKNEPSFFWSSDFCQESLVVKSVINYSILW